MNIERGTFLLLVSTLAIGATGGYVAAERHWFPELDRWRGRTPEPTPPAAPRPPTAPADGAPAGSAPAALGSAPAPAVSVSPSTNAPSAPASLAPAAAPTALPACDDSVATVGECPPPGYPTAEGGCGSFANTRCGELKQAMKPKVAAMAVACLKKLTPQERCDPARVYLCGHLAFMNACPERDEVAAPDAGASGANAASGAKSVASICQAIVDGCAASPVAPSIGECRQLLSGMTETGRERTRTCMKTHCFDRGLVGCEGVTK